MSRVERIRDKLREIKDPCSVSAGRPVDIVSLGLIGRIDDDAGDVSISLVLTEPVCWFSQKIVEAVETTVGQVEGVRSVEAFLDPEEIWDPDRMEPATRAALR